MLGVGDVASAPLVIVEDGSKWSVPLGLCAASLVQDPRVLSVFVNQPSGRWSLLGVSLGSEAYVAFGLVQRSVRGRIYSRAEQTLPAL